MDVGDEVPPFPMMWLSNELLAGVAQRLSDGARRQQELVASRLAAVTRAHGYVHRHELDIARDTADMKAAAAPTRKRRRANEPPTDQPIIRLGGVAVPLSAARVAVLSRISRCRRVVTLRLMMASYFNADSFACWCGQSSVLSGVLAVLISSDRLRLTSVKIDARFGLGLDGVEANVALLLQRHTATITDMRLVPCGLLTDVAATHKHGELCQAVAACTAMQRFTVRGPLLRRYVVYGGCLREVAPVCLPALKQLRALDSPVDFGFDALPRPSQLEELRMNGRFSVKTALSDAARARPDVFASLRVLVIDYHLDDSSDDLDLCALFNQLRAYSPRLEELRVGRFWFGGDVEEQVDQDIVSLVVQFFAEPVPRLLRCTLVVCRWESEFEDEEEHVWSFEEACAELLAAVRAAVPETAISCSNAQVFCLASGDFFETVVVANPAVLASIGAAFAGFVQPPASAAVLATAGSLLVNSTGTGRRVELDYAAAAPFFAAAIAATDVRFELAAELADNQHEPEEVVVIRLTRGHGADERQLDLVIREVEVPIL